MSSEFMDFPDIRLLYIRVSGRVGRQEVLSQSVQADNGTPDWVGYSRLIDTRTVTEIDLVFTNLMERARRSMNIQAGFGGDPIRICLLSGSEVGFGMARMYASLLDVPESPFKVCVTETVAEAAKFLEIELGRLEEICASPMTGDYRQSGN